MWSGFPETKGSVEDAQNLVPFAMPMGASPRPFVQRKISNLRLLLGIGVLSEAVGRRFDSCRGRQEILAFTGSSENLVEAPGPQ